MKVNPLIIGLFLVFFLSSQVESFAFNNSEGLKPKWITQTLPKSKSGTYFFIRGHGEGATLASAKQQAFVSMSLMIEQEHGLTVNTSIRISERLSQSQSFSRNEYQQEIVMDVTENGHLLKIVCREIDEYWELTDSHYSVDVLYAVIDKNTIGTSYDDIITVTSKYGAVGFLSIIPGAGQFYKGSIRKGIGRAHV